jgi:RNA-directed DNA polymerase
MIEKFGYEVYMQDFGGEDAEMLPTRLFGWARYIASVEPNIGYPLLRFLVDNIPPNYAAREIYSVE